MSDSFKKFLSDTQNSIDEKKQKSEQVINIKTEKASQSTYYIEKLKKYEENIKKIDQSKVHDDKKN